MTSFLKKKKKRKKKWKNGLKYVEFIALRYRLKKKKVLRLIKATH